MKNSHVHRKKVGLHLIYHLVILIFSVIIAVSLNGLGFFDSALILVGKLKIFGAFLGGMLYTSAITVGPAAVFLVDLAKSNSLIVLAIVGGLGAALGDVALSQLVRSTIAADFRTALENIRNGTVRSVIHSTFLKWILPVLGAVIIASPLPDEIGLAMLGLSEIRLFHLFPLFWAANSVGIFFLISIGRVVI